MPDTTQRYRIYHYNKVNGYKLIDELNIRNIYKSDLRQPIPFIGERRCKEILKKAIPWADKQSDVFMFENLNTGRKHQQQIYAKGTLIHK